MSDLQKLYAALEEADRRAEAGDEEAKADAIELAQMIRDAEAQANGDYVEPMITGITGGVIGGAKGASDFFKDLKAPAPAQTPIPGAPQTRTLFNPTGQSVEQSVENWRNYADAQNEAAKAVRRDTALAKKYPNFQRTPQPIVQEPEQDLWQRARQNVRQAPRKGLEATGKGLNKITGVNVLSGGMAGYQGADAYNRFQQGDVLGGTVSGIGSIGSGAALTLGKRNPVIRAGGLGLSGAAALINKALDENKAEEKASGGVVGYAGGKTVQAGLQALKKSFTPKQTKVVRASEALGPHEGKYLNLTQSDRMRSTEGDLGGPGFSKFQIERPEYAEAQAAWGVGNKPTASGIINVNKRYPEGKAIWAPMIGSEGQHRSNQHVYDALTDEFARQTSMGKLTPELRAVMNERLAKFPKYNQLGLTDIDVANPEHLKNLGNTFDRRAAITEVIGGEGVGGRKGQIFDYPGIMQEMTDPMTIGSPTHSMGTRLFTLNNEMDYRPDLHSAFPYILKGEDMGVAFNPVPKELAFPEWINIAKEFTGRAPGYMEFTRGIKGKGKPHQFISEEYLRALEAAGHKEGGPIGYAAGKAVKKGFENTVKAYKLFRTDKDGNLYPLFVNANKPVPMGEWLKAEAGPLTEAGKVKSKIGDLAYRPGWHSGEYPVATHIGGKSSGDLKAPDFRPPEQVWAEVEHPADIDWQKVAMERAQKNKKGEVISRTAHITDQIPFGGNYRYKTNPNMTGDWIISGDMKVNRVLPDEEVMRINEEAGVFDLPRYQPLDKKAEGGLMCLKEGGHSSPAWQRKEGKNPEGGLNAAGRASYNRETGGNLKPPVSAEQAKKSPKSAARRKSFCARMSGMEGPMKDEKGRPTRKALALRKWDC